MKSEPGQGFSAAILICSDRAYKGIRPDETAPMLRKQLRDKGFKVQSIKVVPDDKTIIKHTLKAWVVGNIELILTSGGTGVAPSDVTPEATLEAIDRRVPGMEEAMRRESMKITSHAIISRAVVGIAKSSLIINLPGNPKGAVENLEFLGPAVHHALELISGGTPDP